ncbi:hypothetical protein [Geminiviridae sp.]|nr:hypothetical protein [Geminiviridae sp.]
MKVHRELPLHSRSFCTAQKNHRYVQLSAKKMLTMVPWFQFGSRNLITPKWF